MAIEHLSLIFGIADSPKLHRMNLKNPAEASIYTVSIPGPDKESLVLFLISSVAGVVEIDFDITVQVSFCIIWV